jgi:hypothetical protein
MTIARREILAAAGALALGLGARTVAAAAPAVTVYKGET